MVMKTLVFALLGVGFASADLVEQSIDYHSGDKVFEGFHVYDDSVEGKRPGVLVIHQWTGLTDYEKERSRMLAKLGYNVLAADIYGKGVRPSGPGEAGEAAGKFKGDRQLYRDRLMAGLDVLRSDERTDGSRIAAIGYCFGGTGVLELARAGADIDGVVSFHGGLGAAEGMSALRGGVKAQILVCHGADDPFTPKEEVDAFQNEMKEAGADWQFIAYSGAVHSFTQKSAGDDPSRGAAYNAKADKRSWQAMQDFFGEIFAE